MVLLSFCLPLAFEMKSGVYIHIPFCKQACSYCDFHFSTGFKTLEPVMDAILREIKAQEKFEEDSGIQSLYFGGGTPSIISPSYIAAITEALDKRFGLGEMKEFTLEANPDDMHKDNLKAWRDIGINRFSIGIQSFHAQDLEYMNRSHTALQAEDCIKRAQDAGFENISVDLIYGTPGLNDDLWLQNLQKIADLSIPHLSTYALTVEEKTPLWGWIRKGMALAPLELSYARQFELLQTFLQENAYEHYEISNSALKGHRALHNSAYWNGNPYYGFGPSAHGYDGVGYRYANIAHNVRYAEAAEVKAYRQNESLDWKDRVNEYILTRLRLIEGIIYSEMAERFNAEESDALKKRAREMGQDCFMPASESLSLKPGYRLMADGIAAKLFV